MALPTNAFGVGGKFVIRSLGPYTATTTRSFHGHGTLYKITPSRTTLNTQRKLPQPSKRDFSVGPLLEASVDSTQHLLTQLHTLTGTPWFVTIPLFALGFHLVVRVPLAIYTHRVLSHRPRLYPLIATWRVRHSREILADPKWAVCSQKARNAELVKRVTKSTNKVYKTWGTQRWKEWLPLGTLPVWLVGIESVRRLAGAPLGLMGTLISGLAGTPAALDPSSISSSSTEVLPAAQEVLSSVDASMTTGGWLWFTDLTAADPLHILPFALSAIMLANTLPRSLADIRALAGGESVTQGQMAVGGNRPLQRFFVLLAVALGPITMNLPAALHIWWISTSGLMLVQKEVVRKIWPMKAHPIKPSSNGERYFVKPTRTNAPPSPKRN